MEKTDFLPSDFYADMKALLGGEFDEFIASYDKDRYAGLRYNPLKTDPDTFMSAIPFDLTPVPWAKEGFYYDLNDRPGRHPFHEAGAYYIQEPSAMSAVAVLDPQPGDRVLDLCAAPGGKSTQIAGRLNGQGLLVANEIIPSRAKILSQNLERMGVRNAVCLNESPEELSPHFPSFFDRILVDAPCSGEGMFKKEENAASEWSRDHVNMCALRQRGILEEAAKMLKAGGILCYSTCTFNPFENEGTINEFLKAHPEFSIVPSEEASFFSPGRPEFLKDTDCVEGLKETMRLWPHRLKGEGHYVAKLRKEGELIRSDVFSSVPSKQDDRLIKELKTFFSEEMKLKPETIEDLFSSSVPVCFGENIYLCPKTLSSLKGLKVERPGLYVAVSKKNRLEPAHSLALSLKPSEISACVTLNDDEASKYIAGETINTDPSVKGWVLMCAGPFSLGFGKASGGVIKNHYPKGLRIYH